MEEQMVKCENCARLNRNPGYSCMTTGRVVTPQSERKCKYYLRADYLNKIDASKTV